MKTIHVSASRSYDILIERGILTRAGEEIKKVCGAGEALIVSEDTVWPLYGETVLSSMKNAGFDVTSFTFPHGEQSKNLSVYAEILNALAARHISRKGLIVALGGGDALGVHAQIQHQPGDCQRVADIGLAAAAAHAIVGVVGQLVGFLNHLHIVVAIVLPKLIYL